MAGFVPMRSIPACAGEPAVERTRQRQTTVYPRVCGEPQREMRETTLKPVYPRVCGGAGVDRGQSRPEWGLSPRVRGSRDKTLAEIALVGSIPACAGEPCTG